VKLKIFIFYGQRSQVQGAEPCLCRQFDSVPSHHVFDHLFKFKVDNTTGLSTNWTHSG